MFIKGGLSVLGSPNFVSSTKLKSDRPEQNSFLRDTSGAFTCWVLPDFSRGVHGLQVSPASPKRCVNLSKLLLSASWVPHLQNWDYNAEK